MLGRYRNGIPEEERRRLIGCGFSLAILAAPFLALLVSATVGLVVLALALATSAWFAFEAAKEADPATGKRLRLLAGINTLLLAATAAALIWIALT